MLRIVTGAYPDDKLIMYAGEIKRLLAENKQVLAVVPDQFSFQFDRMLYGELGAKDFNRVEVKSFRKLADEILSKLPQGVGDNTGHLLMRQEEKVPIIFLTLREVRKKNNLRVLTRLLQRPAFIGEISTVLGSLIRSQTDPNTLYDCSERIGGAAGDKLHDVATIYEQYLKMLKDRGLRDECSLISVAAAIAKSVGIFDGKYIFVDRFDSFSQDELSMLGEMLLSSRCVNISVTLPPDDRWFPESVYSPSFETVASLSHLCELTGSKIVYSECPRVTQKSAGISAVSDCIRMRKISPLASDGSVEIYYCRSVYDEVDFVAAKIRELVRTGGKGHSYSYNDIAVIVSDIGSYGDALESAFERYDVPYFIDVKHKASDMSVMLYAFALIEAAASRKPDTDRIMKCIRSPFSGFGGEEISFIEDYVVKWNIDGDIWKSDFTAGSQAELERVNAARRRIMEPLSLLHDSCSSADAKTVTSEFCKCIESLGLAERTKEIIESYYDTDEKLETARQFKQLWNRMMSAVASIYSSIGDDKLTLKEFGELMRLTLSSEGISNPPQKLSGVVVYDLSRSVITAPKIAFVMGANDGLFPMDKKKTGIFSGRDALALEREGLKFELSDVKRMSISRFDCFDALTCAEDKLYTSCAVNDPTFKPLRPSTMVTRIMRQLGIKPVKADSLPISLYCSSPEAAFYRLCMGGMDSAERAAVFSALCSLPRFRERLLRLESSDNMGRHSLSPAVSRDVFAAKDINVTASRIDTYNRCPFGYFMRYGLDIMPIEPVKMNPANRGSVMHYVFENVLERLGESFVSATDGELSEIVSELLCAYKNDVLGGDFGKSAKFEADYNRLASACIEILLNMREEFSVSKFRPIRFEYDLSKDNGESVLMIPISRDRKLNIRGIVDRIDAYDSDEGKRYIRVVDYKTGSKAFHFEDVYNGLNLQLLLYMVALTGGTDHSFKDCIPAGIFYMRAGFLECQDDYTESADSDSSRIEKRAEQLKRSGLIVDDDEIVGAMDISVSGKYIPVSKKKDGSYRKSSALISQKSFELLREFAKSKAMEFGNCLLNGRIDAVPAGRDETDVMCRYCEYSSVCARAGYVYKPIRKEDAEKLAEKIGMATGGGSDAELDR